MSELTCVRPPEIPVWYALLDAFVAHEDSALPDPRETTTLLQVDKQLGRLPASEQARLRWLLRALDWLPPILFGWRGPGWWRRMRHLSLARRRRYLESWRTAPVMPMRMGVGALKSLLMLAYYSRPEAWAPIGYDGPWVGRVDVEPASVPRAEGDAGPLPDSADMPGERRA